MRMPNWLLLSIYFLITVLPVSAETKLHPLFCDNAVLQRGVKLPVFGTADNGEDISVTLNGQTQKVKAAQGKWKVVLAPMKAGGPFVLTVKGSNTLTVKNVLIGDVWICTGQSNMASGLAGYVKKYPAVLKGHPGDYKNDKIRLIKFKIEAADNPRAEPTLDGLFPTWKACTPQTGLAFSATGYFFGKNLQSHIKVPVGLIQTCMGGTPAESWTPKEILEGNPKYADIVARGKAAVKGHPAAMERYKKRVAAWDKKNIPEGKKLRDIPWAQRRKRPRQPKGLIKRPAGLYNAMIASIHAFPIKGAIWYQGEANAHSFERVTQYRSLLPDMIKGWRARWGVGDFPFYIVQLAPFKKISETPQDTPWARMRECMTLIAGDIPNCGTASIIDGGSQKDIHPPYKEYAGARLALLARKHTYAQDIVFSGPAFVRMAVAGNKVTLTFDSVGKGLEKKALSLDNNTVKVSGDGLVGFTVCGKDKTFVTAQAKITGNNAVEVWSDKVAKPVAVRYAWADFPLANLYNKEGLPTGPFRTDTFASPATPPKK